MKIISACLALALLSGPLAAHAALTPVTKDGDRMINDSTLNVTWADVESASDLFWSPIAEIGSAQAWVASLNAKNGGRGYGGHNDWRLATGDRGRAYSPVSSANELGSLFFTELGNTANQRVSNLGPFTSLRGNRTYWSGSECRAPGPSAFVIEVFRGLQINHNQVRRFWALAVRSGQVAGAQEASAQS
jgi:hypothetical protein